MNIFVNPAERRPRAGWRLVFQFVVFMLISLLLFAIKGQLTSSSILLLQALIMTAAAVASIYISATLLDRRPFTALGMNLGNRWWDELYAGLAIGAAAISLVFLISWASGWVTITGFGWERASALPYPLWLVSYLASMMLIGFYEELLFRGYHIVNMTEGFRSPHRTSQSAAAGALAVSSLVFGLMHAGNPGASWISTVYVVLAGLVLALPFLLTGRLALSIGLHISWNFFQGGIFGLPVSGKTFRGSLIQIQQKGPELFTGGSFGPEAGLLGLLGLTVILAAVCVFVRNRSNSLSLHPQFADPHLNTVKTHEQG